MRPAPTTPRPTAASEALRAERERAAEAAFARHDFTPVTISEAGPWQHDPAELEDDGTWRERLSRVVTGEDTYDPEHPLDVRAQFNVWFLPDRAEPADAAEGDWVALDD